MKHWTRTAQVVLAVALLALIAGPVTSTRADHGVNAEDLTGKFVSFQDGVLTINIAGGKLAGTHSINIPDGITVIYYPDSTHPKTLKSPGAFANAQPDMTTEVTIDSRMRIVRVALGDYKGGKKHK